MNATLEQTQADVLRLLNLVQGGEEVVITRDSQPVAEFTAVPQARPSPNREAWLAKLADVRERFSTGKSGPTVEQILEEDRGD